jgi:DNA-binding NtrC family response regulator
VNLSQWLGRGSKAAVQGEKRLSREEKRIAEQPYPHVGDPGSPGPDTGSAVRLLLITSDDQFYALFRDIASDRKWSVSRVGTVEQAFPILRRVDVPLILYDWNAPLSDWQEGIRSLTALQPDSCVILASTFADEYLRREVARNRGYDVLPRSADRDKLIRTLQFAWFWRTRSRL